MGREAETQSLQKNNKPLPGRSPGEGNGHPLEYSCLENPMDRGDCRATVLGVAKSWTGLSNEQFKWQQPTVGRSHKVAEWVFSWGARDLNSRSGTSTLRFYKGETSIQNTWLWKLMGSMSKKKKKTILAWNRIKTNSAACMNHSSQQLNLVQKTLWWPRGVRWGSGKEVRRSGYMYTYSWFILLYSRKQYTVKQLSSN